MEKKMKIALQKACEPPKAAKKEDFLRNMPLERISYGRFCLGQTAYISKAVWTLSLVTLVIIMAAWRLMPLEKIRFIAAFMPFLALSAVNESRRSQSFSMAELEMSTRFSLKSVVLARMEIIGVLHLVLVTAAAIFSGADNLPVWQAGVYLLTPYLLVTGLCLVLTRRSSYGEEDYAYLAAAVLVSVGQLLAENIFKVLYNPEYFAFWLGVLLIVGAWSIAEYRRSLKQMEELMWSLS